MLFKYLPSERVDVLENLKIRFSPLVSLNDPFECLPLIDMKNEESELELELNSGLDELWSNTRDIDKSPRNKELLEEARRELLTHLENKISPITVGQKLMSLLGDNFGVLSLSRNKENLLMWSHYASEGKGYVIGFDSEHPFFIQRAMDGKLTKPHPVIYTRKRSKVIPGEKKYYEKLLCTKPQNWDYEEEERLFRTFLDKSNAVGKDLYGQDIILSELPVEAISSIYIGYRATPDTEKSVNSAIKSRGIVCKLYKAELCNEEYKVEFREIRCT